MNISLYLLAQSAKEAAQETAEETKEIVSKITTGKVAQGIFILLTAYLIIKILDRIVIWIS